MEAANEVVVVDVKPAEQLAKPEVAEVFSWTGRACQARGWRYEVWSGAEPTVLRNIRYVGAGRRREFVPEAAFAAAASTRVLDRALSDIETEMVCEGHDAADVRLACLAMIWHRAWSVDMTRPLSSSTVVQEGERYSDV